jgi:putative nucleotidyltransferase with HDIG domain
MIDEQTFSRLKSWYDVYVSRFQSDEKSITTNIELKKQHTRNVCIEILDIANSLELNRQDFLLAEAVALLHDVGRFNQYVRYHTFDDTKSENHAMLGARILSQEGALRYLDRNSRELIIDVVSYHNCVKLPHDKDQRCILFLKLLRDADKIDIWRVVTEYYVRCSSESNSSIELGLPDTPEISSRITEELLAGRIARTKDMRTLNDFKLLQMGWVFDLNFPRAFEIAAERRYLDRIRDTLPDSDIVTRVFRKTKAYLHTGFPA